MTKLAMGELEAAVMDALWDEGGWMTPGEVHEALSEEHPLAYTTFMTVLVRLWEKGRVDRQRDGRAYAYHAVETRDEYAARRMNELLATAGDRSAALTHFLSSLKEVERVQLRRLLASRSRR